MEYKEDRMIRIFGQEELVRHIKMGHDVGDCVISIGGPRWFKKDSKMPSLFRTIFRKKLRLRFHDVTAKSDIPGLFKRIPEKKDLLKAIKFYKKYGDVTIHCWAGVSRSTAIALCLLYLKYKDEDRAIEELVETRKIASPNRLIVSFIDELYGTNFSEKIKKIHQEKLKLMRADLANFVEEL